MTVSQLQGKLGKQLSSFSNRWRFLPFKTDENSLDVELLKDHYIHHGAFLWDPSLPCLFLHLCLYSDVTSSRRPVLRLFLNGSSLFLIQYSPCLYPALYFLHSTTLTSWLTNWQALPLLHKLCGVRDLSVFVCLSFGRYCVLSKRLFNERRGSVQIMA